MEKKKKAEPKAADKKPAVRKAAKESAAKAPAKKPAKPSGKKTPEAAAGKPKAVESGIRKTEAARREVQEEGSIAPPTQNLVSAFDLFRKNRMQAKGPTVTRVAAGGSLPKPPSPKPPPSGEPPPAAPAPLAGAPATAPIPPAAPKSPTVLPTAVGGDSPKPGVASYRESASVPTAPPAARAPGAPVAPGAPPAPSVARPSSVPVARPPYRPSGPGPRPGGHRPSPRSGHGPRHPAPPSSRVEPPKEASAPAAKALKKVQVSSMLTVRELAEKIEVKANDVIAKLITLGIFATINQRLETEAASIVAQEFGFEVEVIALYKEEELQIKTAQTEAPEKLKSRPPVVTVMGHVDHGKTSLLDAIRSARVAEGESGGITQHIGAYQVATPKGPVVFLDTPGHEAFTAMRARGAKITDIVILVVSAVDGVMPQTLEAIDHAKAANVPIIVAVNKVDLPTANPQRIRQELGAHGLTPEEWGGKNIFVDVSAKKRLNLDNLLEMISVQAMVLDIKANPDRPGFGVILEARMDSKRGSVGTILVQAGTVRVGDAFVAGLSYGKIKALIDDTGNRVDAAGPSTPVEVLGLIGMPQAGDVFSVVSDDRQARDIAEKRRVIHREQAMAHQRHMTLVGLKSALAGGAAAAKDLNILLKADTQGSVQALRDSLESLSNAECRVRIIHSGIGSVNESDVLLASASDAVSLLFHTDIDGRAAELAGREGVEIRKYEIIYDLIADVKAALEGLLEPEIVNVVAGRGEVKETFAVRGGKAAGVAVRDGKLLRGHQVRVMRGANAVFEGRIASLKRFREDVKEVEKGLECGLLLDGFADFQRGDLLEFLVKESRTRRLNESRPA